MQQEFTREGGGASMATQCHAKQNCDLKEMKIKLQNLGIIIQ